MSAAEGEPPLPPSPEARASQNSAPRPPVIDIMSNSRSLSRGDSLLWERRSNADDNSPLTPRSPSSPGRPPVLSTSISVSTPEDRFRTSTLLNGNGTHHISSSPMNPTYMASSSDRSASPSVVDNLNPGPTRTFSDDFGAGSLPSSATSLLSKAFTIRTEDIIGNSPTRTTLGLPMNNSNTFFPEKSSAQNGRLTTSSKEDNSKEELCAMAKFSSTLILEHVRHIGENSDASVQCDEFEGATMIVDVSGFTKMCEEFSKGGGRNQKKKDKSEMDDGTHTTAATFATVLYRFNNEQELEGSGGEKVREVLETIMGGIIHIVDEHGGDVLR